MTTRRAGWWVCGVCVLWASMVQAEIKRPVEDREEVLTPQAREALATRLVHLRELTGVSMALVVDSPVDGAKLEDVTWSLLKRWGAQAPEQGILLYVSPRAKQWRLEVGWDVEQTLGPAAADALLKRGMVSWSAGKLDAGLVEVIDGVGVALAKGRYEPAKQPPTAATPPVPKPGEDMAPAAPPEPTHFADTTWDAPGGALTIGAGSRAGLPASDWIDALAGNRRIHDHARALSPSWEAAMVRRLMPLERDHKILAGLVTVGPEMRRGESLARHAERLMRRWLQLVPGGDRVLVVVELEPTPRIEVRTSPGLSRLYTPLRIEALVQEALSSNAHMERVLERVADRLLDMASQRKTLEALESAPVVESPVTRPEPRADGEPSALRVVFMMAIATAMVGLCALFGWVVYQRRPRGR